MTSKNIVQNSVHISLQHYQQTKHISYWSSYTICEAHTFHNQLNKNIANKIKLHDKHISHRKDIAVLANITII